MKHIVFLSHIDMNLYLFRKPIMQKMATQGWQVTALVPNGAYSNRFAELGIHHVPYEIDRGSMNPITEFFTIIRLWKILSKLHPTIIHTFTPKPNIYGTIAAKLARIPLIINSITGLGSYLINEGDKSKSSVLFIKLFKIVAKLNNMSIFQNSDDLKLFLALDISTPSKVQLIRGSGVDLNLFDKTKYSNSDLTKTKRKYAISENQVVVTCVARLLIDKGICEFCEAAQTLKSKWGDDVIFLLVGDFYSDNPSAIGEDYIHKFTSTNIIKHIGWVDNMPLVYLISNIVTLPSYREGLSVSLQEALAMSKPIITTDVPGCRETVESNLNGILIPKQDSEALSAAIDELLEKPQARLAMGVQSRKKAESEFDAEHISNQHTDLYYNLLNRQEISRKSQFKYRVFDISLLIVSAPIVVPIILFTAIIQYFIMGVPLFFTQLRPGRYEVPFNFIKFRSMTYLNNYDGSLASDAERLTRFGKFLRQSSIDELPSLWNVLNGDMSIVGPRPLLLEYTKLYSPTQARRSEVKPGITGWAQINGRNAISWEEKFALDVWYVENKSILLNMKIVLMTIKKVLFQKDINAPNLATMEKFQGNN